MTHRIGFIGAGNMATSIIGGMISQGSPASSITVADAMPGALVTIADKFGVNTCATNQQAIENADTIVLAVKPDVMQSVCTELAEVLGDDCLFVSVAAGVRADDILRWLGKNAAIVRCMPNTPALLNLGASALFANQHCSSAQREQAEKLLSAAGLTLWVDSEQQIDAVTALSGSGPAYFFHLIECMTQAASDMGLPKDTAETLAIETAFGAAAMARQRITPAAQLRENVTSKGGTTAAALAVFSAEDFAGIVSRAMAAAKSRAESLGDELGRNASV